MTNVRGYPGAVISNLASMAENSVTSGSHENAPPAALLNVIVSWLTLPPPTRRQNTVAPSMGAKVFLSRTNPMMRKNGRVTILPMYPPSPRVRDVLSDTSGIVNRTNGDAAVSRR